VIALVAIELGDALDGEVVALGRAAGADDLLAALVADDLRALLARVLDHLLGFPSETMIAAGSVAELLGEVGQHSLDHARIDRGRGVVVEGDGGPAGHELT